MEATDEPKQGPISTEMEQAESTMSLPPDDQDALDAYRMSWRTIAAFLVLSLAWSVSTGAIVGPNTSIAYIVQDFLSEAASASWIANTGIFCIVTLPPIIGATSDRYGKKWFIITGALTGIVGSMVSAEATNLKVVIGGQALSGIGQSMLIVAVPAGMEIVPAKYRIIMISSMAIINGTLGPIGFSFICELQPT
jgi:MFS family permease